VRTHVLTQRSWSRLVALACVLACAGLLSQAFAAPVLLGSAGRDSDERAVPGALLLLPGAGLRHDDTVWFREEGGTRERMAPVVATHLLPGAHVVRLPADLRADRVHRLWVRSAAGERSGPVLLNAARPEWFSPARVHASAPLAGLPRQLRIVGRNLDLGFHAGSPRQARVRLVHAGTRAVAELAPLPARPATAVAAGQDGDELRRHLATFALPARLAPGAHRVEWSADGVRWQPVAATPLQVLPDPMPREVALPAACRPDDGRDDTPCMVQAIALLARAAPPAGGVIRLPAGVLEFAGQGADPVHGLLLPRGVSIIGAGRERTRVVRGDGWRAAALFTLQGGNRVSGIRFEERARAGLQHERRAVLVLGLSPRAGRVVRVDDVQIDGNTFAWVNRAIVASGVPIDRLVVAGNEFGADRDALLLDADRGAPSARFVVRDSIVRNNRFLPGGFVDCGSGQGTIASQVGASQRLDFSDNVADGRARDYLRAGEAPGWRAAFFWHLLGPQDDVLVAANRASCTGDKAGDGEFLAFDNNGNTTPFPGLVRDVAAAAATHVDIAARADRRDWHLRWWNAAVDDGYYVGHWLFVVHGHGLGQVRRIEAVERRAGSVRLRIAPGFAVVPGRDSRIVVTRAFHRLRVVGNEVDLRGCTGRNANRLLNGGGIGLWASASDSVIAGNRQHRAGGILLQSQFDATNSELFLQYHTQVRANLVDGEPAVRSACSTSGIQLHHSARTWLGEARPATPVPVPIVQAYGVRVQGNTVRGADGLRGGAVVFPDSWHRVPGSRMYLGTIIDGNALLDLPRLPASPAHADPCRRSTCGGDAPVRGVGVHITDDAIVGTLLDGNTFDTGRGAATPRPLLDNGTATRVLR
jgi:hypothetical protein